MFNYKLDIKILLDIKICICICSLYCIIFAYCIHTFEISGSSSLRSNDLQKITNKFNRVSVCQHSSEFYHNGGLKRVASYSSRCIRIIQLQCYDILTVSPGISGTYKRRGQSRTCMSGPTP